MYRMCIYAGLCEYVYCKVVMGLLLCTLCMVGAQATVWASQSAQPQHNEQLQN